MQLVMEPRDSRESFKYLRSLVELAVEPRDSRESFKYLRSLVELVVEPRNSRVPYGHLPFRVITVTRATCAGPQIMLNFLVSFEAGFREFSRKE